MKVLVTGGAGYIGSFMVKRLLDDGNEVVVVDSLERGHESILDHRATFEKGATLDSSFLKSLFEAHTFDAVIHFAAYISVAESVREPGRYFANNVFGTLNLLEQMASHNVNKFIFSSTAAVYGNPVKVPIPEDHQKNPENPYGESKLMVEQMLPWYEKTHKLRYVVLRYFNASGAALDGSMGEAHDPELHIIPNAIKAVLEKRPFKLFGTDYGTPDGTCVRDYIHVLDLIEAHILGLKKITDAEGGFTFNVGTGKGYSNKEVIDAVQRVSGEQLEIEVGDRRAGDADELVADPSVIKTSLGFEPKHSDLETIVTSAWKWHVGNRTLA